MASELILNISDDEFESAVVKSDIPVVVDFWAPWCGPCRMVAPQLEALASEYNGKVKVVKVNVDDHQLWAGKLGVMSIPTLVLYKNGEPADKIIGAVSKEEIVKRFGLN